MRMMPSKANKLAKEEGESEGFYFDECLVDETPAIA
jgi:hypothetical protein